MNNKEKDIINNLPFDFQELATDILEAIKDKDAKRYNEVASVSEVVYNRKQFDCRVIQSFFNFVLPKAVEAGVIQPPQQPPAKPENPNMVAEKVVGKTEVKVDTKTAKKK